MPFKANGVVLPDPEHIRIREMVEAEKALDLKFDETGTAGKVGILLFVAMRRENKEKPVALLADEVMNMDIAAVEEVEEESPPALAAVDGDGMDRERQQTSGLPPSAQSA